MSLYGGDREEQQLSEAGLSGSYSGVHYVSCSSPDFKNGNIGVYLT